MKNTFCPLRRGAIVCALAVFGFAGGALAQRAEVGKIDFDSIPSPQFSGVKNKSFKPKDWLEFETSIKVPAFTPEQNKSGFVDEATVTWTIALQNPDGRGYIKLAKNITHINIPVDEEVFVSAYLSPSTIKRLTGKDSAGKSSVDRVAVELVINGRVVAAESSKGKPDWMNSGNLSDQSSRFPLLKKSETPFAPMWWYRYAEIKEERR